MTKAEEITKAMMDYTETLLSGTGKKEARRKYLALAGEEHVKRTERNYRDYCHFRPRTK